MRSLKGSLAALLSLVLMLAACGGGDGDAIFDPGPASTELDPNVPPVILGSWDRPAPSESWQWQLQGPINLKYDVKIYDVDLWESPDEVLAELSRRGTRVLCYFSAGSAEQRAPDHGAFPAAALGRVLEGYPSERWLDIRRRDVFAVIVARLELAVHRGCDGVEPDNVTAFENETGFGISATDQLAFNRNLANEAHRRGLFVALKNDNAQAAQLVEYFDLELNEQCHQYDECEPLSVFTAHAKPVLNAEYAADLRAATAKAQAVCPAARAANIRTLILHADLDDRFRVSCN